MLVLAETHRFMIAIGRNGTIALRSEQVTMRRGEWKLDFAMEGAPRLVQL